MSPGAGESGAGGGLPQSRRKLRPLGSGPTLADVLGQQGWWYNCRFERLEKRGSGLARFPAVTPQRGPSRQSES